MSSEWYYAKPGPITPVVLPGQKIAIWAGANWRAFKCDYLEPLPRSNQLIFDMGAVAAGGASALVALTNLELQTDPPEMAQLRFYPLDDITVDLRRGQSDQRFKTFRMVAQADVFTQQIDPCLHTTEIVVLKEDEPTIRAANRTGYALAQSRVAFFGFRFILKSLGVEMPRVEDIELAVGAPVTFVAAGGR